MRIMSLLLLIAGLVGSPVAAQTTPPSDPDHTKIVDAIVPKIEGVDAYVGQVNAEVKKALTKLEALTTQLRTLADQVTAVSTAVTALAGQVTTLDGKVVALDTKVTGLESDVLALPIEIAAEGVGSQLLTMQFFLHTEQIGKTTYVPILSGWSKDSRNIWSSGTMHGTTPYGSSAFGTAFPAGTLDTFSFALAGGGAYKGTCDVTATVRDDGADTILSGTVVDYDYEADVVNYADPDTIEIAAGSIMNLALSFSGCTKSPGGSQWHRYDFPQYISVSVNFTPAAAVEEVETPNDEPIWVETPNDEPIWEGW